MRKFKSRSSQIERIRLLEEQMKLLFEYAEGIQDSHARIVSDFKEYIKKSKDTNSELTRWANSVEERLVRVSTQHANLSFIFHTLNPVTEVQEAYLKEQAAKMKKG